MEYPPGNTRISQPALSSTTPRYGDGRSACPSHMTARCWCPKTATARSGGLRIGGNERTCGFGSNMLQDWEIQPETPSMNASPDRPENSIDPKLLEILVCPLTKGPLEFDAARQELISRSAKLAYPIRDGIPIMLPEEARKID